MILQRTSLLIVLIFQALFINAQETPIHWWNPASCAENVIEGKGWSGDQICIYGRLPQKAKPNVRDEVWNLSQNTAGLSIRFRTNSLRIKVRYQVDCELSFPHMPSTGRSGLDMYTKDSDGNSTWCRGKYTFGDTIT